MTSTTSSTTSTIPSAGVSNVSIITDNGSVEKPLLDNRSYRLVKLNKNNLHVLLIHDPTTDKLAASLDVNVGAFADSKYKVSGLAHFCEHLLFMGTKKYPQENEYSNYLSKHSGHSNAYTAAEHTNYYFEVDSKFLHGALDRFGQFFIEPLFSKSCKDREIKAVDLENKKNLQNDIWRSYQLDKSLSNPKHPYNGFSTGNFQTLHVDPINQGLDVREVLLDYYSNHYSSNIMSLVILGKENLDELEQWAEQIFDAIPNKDLPRPNYHGELIFTPEQLNKVVKLKSVLDHHKLEISFKIPNDQDTNWDSKPGGYFSHLLGHEAEGSLFHYLKQVKGWCNELSAGQHKVCQGSSQFDIDIDLTIEGLNNWEEIVVNTFQYIDMVTKQHRPQKWICDEISKMSEINFKFQQKRGAATTVSKMSNKLIKFYDEGVIPSNFILSSGIIREYNEQKISEYGSWLNRGDNFRISLASQEFEGLKNKEEWYGTEYSFEEFPNTLTNKLSHLEQNSHFHLPLPNDFIPTDFTLFNKVKKTPETSLKHPYLVKDNTKFQLWYKLDDQFEVPKGTVECVLHLPNSNVSCKSSIFSSIWAELIEEELNEIAYYASIVGLSFGIHPWRDGFLIRVSGYNDKLKVLLQKVIAKLIDFEPKSERFEIVKYKLQQDFKNFGYGVPYNQIGTHFLTFVNDKTYTDQERLSILRNKDEITYDQFVNFIGEDEVWKSGIFGEILVHGNFQVSDCEEVYSIFEKTFENVNEVAPSLDELNSVVRLENSVIEKGSRYRYELPLEDAKNINSCIEYYIQIGEITPENDKLRVLTDLFCTIINEPCFAQLRTKEQLGYVVFLGFRLIRTSFGFRILIQSERTTDYLEYRIEEFLSKFGQFIQSKLTNEVFDNFKQALRDKKLTKLKNLNEEVSRFWNGIIDGYYDFQIKEKQVKILDDITLAEFQEFFSKYILEESATGRIIVHLKSQSAPSPSDEKLIHSSIINYLFRNDLHLGSDTLEELLDGGDGEGKKFNLDELSLKVTQALIDFVPSEQEDGVEGNTIPDKKSFAAELKDTIEEGLKSPVPSKYPTGQKISIADFKNNSKKGGIPVPVVPLKSYYLPADPEDTESHL